VVEFEPNDDVALGLACFNGYAASEPSKALDYCNRAIILYPNKSDGYYSQVLIYKRMKNYAYAMKGFNKAI
jgi:tetratricopeptide (TPR) repeat protein